MALGSNLQVGIYNLIFLFVACCKKVKEQRQEQQKKPKGTIYNKIHFEIQLGFNFKMKSST